MKGLKGFFLGEIRRTGKVVYSAVLQADLKGMSDLWMSLVFCRTGAMFRPELFLLKLLLNPEVYEGVS